MKASSEAAQTPPPSGARGALTLMIGTLASRVTGLLRISLLNQLYSQTVTDAFNVALKIPNLFRELLAEGALTNAFVPVYKGLSRDEARRLSGALLSLLLAVNTVLVLLAVLFAPALVSLLLSGGNVDFELAVTLTRVVFPFLAAISFSALAMGILQSEERFFAPAWAPVMLNLTTAVLMLLFPGQAVMLALAFVAGGVAQFAFQLPFLVRLGVLPRPRFGWHPALTGVVLLMTPFAFTTGARQFLNVIATRILDQLPPGSQTAFVNAETFLSLALGLFSISPALAYYSRLSADAVEAPERFVKTLREGLGLIAFLTVPAGLMLLLLAEPAVQAVLNWMTAFDPAAGADPQTLALSAAALAPLGLAVFPMGLNNLLLRTFYVRRLVRVPVALVAAFALFNALLYAALAPRYGIAGLSWATVVVMWAQLAVLLALVSRREGLSLLAFLARAGRLWLAGFGAAGFTALLLALLPEATTYWHHLLRAALGIGVMAGGYALFCLAARVSELERLRDAILRRLKDK